LLFENLKRHPILAYRNISFNRNTILRPPPVGGREVV
jgi:hypothetical protein